MNSNFQLQIDAIRSVDDIERVEFIIKEKKALLKNSKDVHESDKLFAELDGFGMVATSNRKIFLRTTKKQLEMRHCCCSRCGKKPKEFVRTSENPLICLQCMVVNVDS